MTNRTGAGENWVGRRVQHSKTEIGHRRGEFIGRKESEQ
jgi:hypothetical protein